MKTALTKQAVNDWVCYKQPCHSYGARYHPSRASIIFDETADQTDQTNQTNQTDQIHENNTCSTCSSHTWPVCEQCNVLLLYGSNLLVYYKHKILIRTKYNVHLLDTTTQTLQRLFDASDCWDSCQLTKCRNLSDRIKLIYRPFGSPLLAVIDMESGSIILHKSEHLLGCNSVNIGSKHYVCVVVQHNCTDQNNHTKTINTNWLYTRLASTVCAGKCAHSWSTTCIAKCRALSTKLCWATQAWCASFRTLGPSNRAAPSVKRINGIVMRRAFVSKPTTPMNQFIVTSMKMLNSGLARHRLHMLGLA